ncbi:deaminase [Henriciella marina]|uniref:Deaminase n=2 Tax=Henriciella marina TaxID=453851 RepID=A0ABT4LVN2_9PROT|nr:deaminase [Henriciella marina]
MLNNWDRRYLELAIVISGWSEDPDRKVGCVIVGRDSAIRAIGFNGLPRSISNQVPSRFEREGGEKYRWFEHAETNAIFAAARAGIKLEGSCMYLSWFPCDNCARAIIQAGINRLVASEVDLANPVWGPRMKLAHSMLEEAGVELVSWATSP